MRTQAICLLTGAILTLSALGFGIETALGEQIQETPILIRQGEFQATIFPLVRAGSAERFYNYSTFDYQSKTSLEIPRYSLIFFHRDTLTGKLSLIIIHNAPNAGSGGKMSLSIEGLPNMAKLTVKDDPNDQYVFEPPNAQISWRWAPGRTDGLVISDLTEPLTLKIIPQSIQGIMGWKLLSQGSQDQEGIRRVPLPSLTEPIQISIGEGPPVAAFHWSPQVIRIGVPVLFDARPSQVLRGEIVRYEWDFDGDGIFDLSMDQPLVSFVFKKSGTFTVRLRITDRRGFTTTASQTIEVREEKALVRRMLSTPQAIPGSTFRVTIEFIVEVTSNGLGLEEQLPLGWKIEPVRTDGAIFKFKNSRGQWLFPVVLKSGETKRLIYDVRVPQAEELTGPPLPAKFPIRGLITSASPAYTIPIGGESEVEVVSCLSEPVAISHLDLMRDEVDLRLSETISPEQLSRAVLYWQTGALVPGACDARMTSEALQRVLTHQLLKIPVDQPLPPPFADPASPPVRVTRKITTPLPSKKLYLPAEGGNVFQVELVAQAQQDLPGLRIIEQLPEGWHVEMQILAGAVFRPSANGLLEWVFPELIPAGQSRRLVYEVTVPPDAKPGVVSLKGSSESGILTFVNVTQGDSTVELVECLSILLAIAHLAVKTGQIDVRGDNLISREEAEAAFLLWFNDEEVPGTCGQKLDLIILQEIVTYVVTGQPVER